MKYKTLLAVALASCSWAAVAAPVLPQFTTFGALPQADFGGTGIPNTAVAITEFGSASVPTPNNPDCDLINDPGGPDCFGPGPRVTMGLTATQRFANQTVTNDGNGTFTAHRGFDTSAGSPYATWNFDYYLSEVVPTGQTTPTYFYRTFIDINPAVGNSIGEYIDITPTAPLPGAFPNAAGTYVVQDSFNLGQLFGAGAGTVAGGQYGLVIQAYDSEGFIMPENAVSILVNIDTPAVVPEPGSLALIGLGLAGLAVARKRKAK